MMKFALTIALFVPHMVFSQQESSVTLQARLASERVPLNGTVKLTVEARWLAKSGDFTIDSIDEPKLTNLQLVETATSNQVLKENQTLVTRRIYEYTLQGETYGMAYIDEMRLHYSDSVGQSHILEAPRLSLQVVDPIAGPMSNDSLPIAVAGLLALLGAVAAILWSNDRKKNRKQVAAESEAQQTLEQQFTSRLRQEVDVHAGNLSEQYQNIAQLLRGYLHQSMAIETRVATTEELLQQLHSQQIEMSKITSVQEILQACDVQKFSGGSGDPSQLNRLFSLFETLLQEPFQAKNNAEQS